MAESEIERNRGDFPAIFGPAEISAQRRNSETLSACAFLL